MTLTCIHAEKGLCPDCQEQFDEDPISYEDYGDHPAGIERWEALKAEMDAEAAATRCLGYGVPAFDDHSTDDYIPF